MEGEKCLTPIYKHSLRLFFLAQSLKELKDNTSINRDAEGQV
jgi:hypothetical protein